MSALRKLASQTAIYGLSSIIGRLVVWGLTPIYTAKLLPGEYGVFSDLYSFVTYFLVILTFGLETSFFRFSSDDKSDLKPYNQAFLFVTGMAIAFFVIFGLGHQSFANFLGYADRPGLVMMVVGIIFLDVLVALPMAKLRFDERPMVFAAISLMAIFVNIAFNIYFILILGKTNAEYVFIANLISSIFKFSVLALVSSPLASRLQSMGRIGKKLSEVSVLPSSLKYDPQLMKAMLGFGLFIMLAGLFGMINQYSDVNFIKRVWGDDPLLYDGVPRTGEAMAGIYSANKKLAVFILLVTQAFRYAAEPFFFKEAKKKQSREDIARIFHYFMIASLGVFLLVSSFAYEFVSTRILGFQIIDQQYHSGLKVVPLLLFAMVLWGGYINISIWFKLTKQVRFGLLFSGAGTAIILVLHLILIPGMGYMGAAISMLVCYSFMLTVAYLVGQRYYPIPYRLLRLGFYTLLVLGTFWLNHSLGDSSLFSGIFMQKLLFTLICFGLIVLIEKMYPLNWYGKQVAPAKPKTPKVPKKKFRPSDDGPKENRMREQ